ncbi:MAG: ABC transporter ATP-binding protein, partial [Burkholderiaceae bacterium]
MIVLDQVSKSYGSKAIIHGISFDVKQGEIVGFLGPNGAGKTTVMRMIAGFTEASAGTVSVCGFDMATQRDHAAPNIGYLPESPPLYDVLDVTTYLRFVARAKHVPANQIAEQLDRVIQACRLEAVTQKECYKLSKGYRQRVGLAQALLGKPKVLLLDEPTAGLDPGQIQETREVIRNFGSKHAVLISTHILPEVTLICQRVAIINGGRLLAVDSPNGLQQRAEQSNSVLLDATGDQHTLEQSLRGVNGVSGLSIRPHPVRQGVVSIECLVQDMEGIESRIARAVMAAGELYRLE